MADVARCAGVSHQTVSRVLNSPGQVSENTRLRVQAAIDELGYRPHLAARALVTRRSGLLGLVVDHGGHSGPDQTALHIQRAARGRGYTTVVSALGADGVEELETVLDRLVDHRVEGIVVIAPHRAFVERLEGLPSDIPRVVVADTGALSARGGVVCVDQCRAGRLATEHLLALGHRSIAHLRGPVGWFDADQRERGWREALRAAGVAPGPLIVGDWQPASGHAAALHLLAGAMPQAVVVGNDLMALGMLVALREAGVRVPQDVSIVGHDDVEGAGWFSPPLTTIRQPLASLGEACVDGLLEMLSGGPEAALRIPPKLVVRASTGPVLGR